MSTRVPRQGLALAAVLALFTAVPAANASHGTSHQKHHAKVRAASADWDHDGLNNRYEHRSRTNPRLADSDHDGVNDGLEDRDGDGVDNHTEQLALTRPGKVDSDHDGTPDGAEDPDHDGLNNAGESAAGTHPRKADTDGDGVKDGDEHAGTISAVDGLSVTIALYGGGTLTGKMDDFTDIYSACVENGDDSDVADDSSSDDADPLSAGDFGGDVGDGSDNGVDDPSDDTVGADDPSDDANDDFGDERSVVLPSGGTCVVVGARVYEADVETNGTKVTFVALDLLGG